MPDPLPNREGKIGSGDRAYNVSFPSPRIKGNNTLACIAYGSVVCLHPLVVIGATVQAASQRRILAE